MRRTSPRNSARKRAAGECPPQEDVVIRVLRRTSSARAAPRCERSCRRSRKSSTTTSIVLILGESGTGKDYLAEAIHACGTRRDEPFVTIDCAAHPRRALRVASSSATRRARSPTRSRASSASSRPRAAARSTSTTSPRCPRRCRRSCSARIQEKRFTRLGGNQTVVLRRRVISSSSMPAEELLSGLRRDLFYRINVVTLTIPPLRERREDIPRLAQDVSWRGRKRGIDAEAMRCCIDYAWPGNVRELRNVDRTRRADRRRATCITAASLPPLSRDLVDAAARQPVDARRARSALHPRSPARDAIELLARRRDPRHQPQDAAGEEEKVWDRLRVTLDCGHWKSAFPTHCTASRTA